MTKSKGIFFFAEKLRNKVGKQICVRARHGGRLAMMGGRPANDQCQLASGTAPAALTSTSSFSGLGEPHPSNFTAVK